MVSELQFIITWTLFFLALSNTPALVAKVISRNVRAVDGVIFGGLWTLFSALYYVLP